MDVKDIKSTARPLDSDYVNTKGQIFLKRYCGSLQIKRQQSYQQPKLKVSKKFCCSASLPASGSSWAKRQTFFLPPTLTLVALMPFDLQRPTVPLLLISSLSNSLAVLLMNFNSFLQYSFSKGAISFDSSLRPKRSRIFCW